MTNMCKSLKRNLLCERIFLFCLYVYKAALEMQMSVISANDNGTKKFMSDFEKQCFYSHTGGITKEPYALYLRILRAS